MPINYLFLIPTLLLTGAISVSTHVIILQFFQAPELRNVPHFEFLMACALMVCTVGGSFVIYLYSKEYWCRINLFLRVVLFAILLMALTESLLRVTVMNIIVGAPWSYQTLVSIPSYFGYFTISFMACLFLQKASERKQFRIFWYLILTIITTLLFYSVRKLATHFLDPLLAKVTQPTGQVIQLPYGIDVLIPAYLTYLEPTIASFILYYLIKDRLSKFNALIQGMIVGAIISMMHAGLYSILQIVSSEGNIFYRTFYYGQFLWEYIVLGLLTVFFVFMQEKVGSVRQVDYDRKFNYFQ